MADYITDSQSKRLIFYAGKGGVGKTTLVLATARVLADQGRRVAVAAWTGPEARPNALAHSVQLIPLETMPCFKEYVLQVVRFERLYDTIFENRILRTFVLAAPGLSDTVIAGKLWDVYRRQTFDTILVDLPSSGHALSFFHSPLGVKRVFSAGFIHKETEHICEMFSRPDVRIHLVALPEELPVVECLELKSKLSELHPFRFGFLLLNQMLPEVAGFQELAALATLSNSPLPTPVLDYLVRFHRQQDNLARAKAAELPMVSLPYLPTPNESSLIERLAREMAQRDTRSHTPRPIEASL